MLTSTRYQLYPGPAFVEQYKAIKNDIEIRGFRNAYLRDGAAMVRFFAWLDEKMRNNEPVTEWGAAQRLSDFRRQNEYFICLAYENISATGGNAALPHYSPTRGTASFINTTTPYLNDSGGNYLDGTCDTTRTVHFGAPKQEQMEAFTRVLQGHIAIDSAIFPEGTTGQQLDVLARKALWKDGLNYMHGTGHGFGSFLNVHEGPHGFSSSFPLVPGHVITNEPGFYKDNEFGIRIESALLVKKVETKGKFGGSDWYGFERFTQVPIQTRMVRWDMLNHEEKDWIRAHNLQCLEKLAPLLQSDKRALKWLKRECTRGTSAGSAAGVSVEWD
jgi:Xaa-Pro aminopeptidase